MPTLLFWGIIIRLFPYITFIIGNPILFQKRQKLGLKCAFFVVFVLGVNVRHNRVELRRIDRKFAIPILPIKTTVLRALRFYPFGG